MESGIEYTLGKFSNNTKLCGAVNTLEGRDAIQSDLDRLERWACAKLKKFNKDTCKVLHMGWGNPKHKCRLGGGWIESSSEEKDLGVLVNDKLNMTRQCVLAAQKASCLLGCIPSSAGSRVTEVIMPFYSALLWWDPPWSPVCSSGALSTGRTWTCWSWSRGGPQKWSEDWNTSAVRKGWDSWGCAACRREGSGDTLKQPSSTWRGLEESRRGTFYQACRDRTSGDGFKLNEVRFRLKEEILFYEGCEALEEVTQSSCGCPLPRSVQGPSLSPPNFPCTPSLLAGGVGWEAEKALTLFKYWSATTKTSLYYQYFFHHTSKT